MTNDFALQALDAVFVKKYCAMNVQTMLECVYNIFRLDFLVIENYFNRYARSFFL